jgi:hypothetical protein
MDKHEHEGPEWTGRLEQLMPLLQDCRSVVVDALCQQWPSQTQ